MTFAGSAKDVVGPAVSDPMSLGEDHARNIRLALAVAPVRCRDCLNYHMLFPVYRHVGRVSTIFRDRLELIRRIGQLVAERCSAGQQRVDILILGSADTQILATCAHAALTHAEKAFSRIHFTVLDICGTPLELCRDYAARHDLAISTREIDVTRSEEAFPADVIVLHSLLSHLPREAHLPLLQTCGRWLKPDGRVIFSTSIKTALSRARNRQRRDQADDLIKLSIESGEFEIGEPIDVFLRRLKERPGQVYDFAGVEEVRNLFAGTDLAVLSFDEIRGPSQLPSGLAFERSRVLAVLGRQSE